MARGISINFLADVKSFLRGAKDVEDELDDVADALDDVAKDGEQATEKLEKSFRELAREASASGDKAGDGLGKGVKRGTRDAEEGIDTLKQNADSNAKEVAASFDGSIESIADGFQGLAAEAFEGWGTAGIVAGVGVAAGIGLATAAIQKAQEDAAAFRDRVNELTQELIDAGEAGQVSTGFIAEKLKELADAAEDGADSLANIKELSEETGNSFDKLASFFAGNAEGLDELIDKEKALQDTLHDGLEVQAARVQALDEEDDARDELISKLEEQQKEIEAAAEAERLYLESGGAEWQAKADAIDMINSAYDEAVSSISDFRNEETGVLDIEGFINSIQARKDALAQYQTDLATLGLTTAQKAALNDMGIEAASDYLEGIKTGTPEQSEYLKNELTTMASEASGLAKDTIEEAFATPTEHEVKVEADTKTFDDAMERLLNKPRKVRVEAVVVDRDGREYR